MNVYQRDRVCWCSLTLVARQTVLDSVLTFLLLGTLALLLDTPTLLLSRSCQPIPLRVIPTQPEPFNFLISSLP